MKNSKKNRDFFTNRLLDWHRHTNRRIVPWKKFKDAYSVWVSEIILQQTRLEYGKEYIERFLDAYPNVQALAAAPPDEVFRLWQGLGYYNRCRNMLETAKWISASSEGRFPNTYEGILALKGIGPYTAAAIASFAYGLPHAVVDGNVIRVFSRFYGISTSANGTAGQLLYRQLAQEHLAELDPGSYNQAIMDFGATVCKPANPHCDICPLKAGCFAYTRDQVQDYPPKSQKIQKKERYFHFLIVGNEKEIYIEKRNEKDIWRNLYQFPLIEAGKLLCANELTQNEEFRQRFRGAEPAECTTVKPQLLTHQKIHGRFFSIRGSDLPKEKGWRAVKREDLGDFAFPRIITSYLRD